MHRCHRVSVFLSIISWHCTKMAEPRITQRTPYDNPVTPFFWCQWYCGNSYGVTTTAAPNRSGSGRLKVAIFYQYLAISQKRCKTGT